MKDLDLQYGPRGRGESLLRLRGSKGTRWLMQNAMSRFSHRRAILQLLFCDRERVMKKPRSWEVGTDATAVRSVKSASALIRQLHR